MISNSLIYFNYLSSTGNTNEVTSLIKNGINLNVANENLDGITPLQWAILKGTSESVNSKDKCFSSLEFSLNFGR